MRFVSSLHLGSVISSTIQQDKVVKRELNEYSSRLTSLVERLQADLGERNTYNNHRTIRGKSKKKSEEKSPFVFLAVSTIIRRGGEQTAAI